jgi:hypothetical protein
MDKKITAAIRGLSATAEIVISYDVDVYPQHGKVGGGIFEEGSHKANCQSSSL